MPGSEKIHQAKKRDVTLRYCTSRLLHGNRSPPQVVLVAHSQGTIIASDVLWHLWEAVDRGDLPKVSDWIVLVRLPGRANSEVQRR